MTDSLWELDENAHLASCAVQEIMLGLGPSGEMDMGLEAPTLWGGTSSVGDEVLRLSDDATGIAAQCMSLQSSI